MNPIAFLNKILRNRKQLKLKAAAEAQLQAEIEAFRAEVDVHVRVFRLDPATPEIIELKENAREWITRMGTTINCVFLWLNPYKSCTLTPGVNLVIQERWFGHILHPWTLAEFHIGQDLLLRRCQRIRIDQHGTHIFDDRGIEYVRYEAGVLNPNRFADPGNRVDNATRFVNYFTGLSLEMEQLWPMYWAEFTKGEDDKWSYKFGEHPAVKV